MDKSFELKVDVDQKSLTDTTGQFTIQPLERGYGITLGNAMRRVLLTSIPGAAITHVKIEGVQHEFSSLKGVKGDVADIFMNLKAVRFKLMDNNPDKVSLSFKGKKVFTAKQIQDASDQFEILNPDQYITEINSSGKLELELRIGIGKGYVPAIMNKPEEPPLGLIPIDSLFSPVKKVSYSVSTAREGKALDYDKLIMEVETNGSISAEDAVAYSAKIFQDQLNMFVNFDEPKEVIVRDQPAEPEFNKNLLRKVDELELSVLSLIHI